MEGGGRRKGWEPLSRILMTLFPSACSSRNADVNGALLWEPNSGFQCQPSVSLEQVVSPPWASLFVGINQYDIVALLSPWFTDIFAVWTRCVSALWRGLGTRGSCGLSPKAPPSSASSPVRGHTLQLLLTPRSPNSVAAFIFFLQGPPGLPGPPGPPGPPGAVVNIKGVSQDGARDHATGTRSASAVAGFPEGLTPHILSLSYRLFSQYLPGHTAKLQ